MIIEVAGAGAGKTTSMASRILECEIPEGKVCYCVAFTNAAVDNIRAKLEKRDGSIPDQIKVSTIHSFLYGEIIRPYYHLLFEKHYRGISGVNLPSDYKYRNHRISELDKQGMLHFEAIPQRAKWVVDHKSGDTVRTCSLRAKVLEFFSGYCHKIYVDEAQDINSDMQAVFMALDSVGIEIELHGDPKQDIKGHGCFRRLINACSNVTYSSLCYRSPQLHLQLSNKLACLDEQQVAAPANRAGKISIYFESQVDATKLVEDWSSGLVYMSRKNGRFDTHCSESIDSKLETVKYEIESGIREKYGNSISDLNVDRRAYYAAKHMTEFVVCGGEPKEIIGKFIGADWFDYEKKRYARLLEALSGQPSSEANKIAVQSIEAVKGLEAERCLFILTTDLAPYLLGDKTDDNKIKHLLYVALTRSSDELGILVTTEVEAAYSHKRILGSLATGNKD